MKDKNTGAPINQEEISHYLKDIRRIKVMTAEREKELAKKIAKLIEFDGEIYWDKKIEDGAKIKVLSNLKMKKQLQWKPKINLDEGLKKLILNLNKRNFFNG